MPSSLSNTRAPVSFSSRGVHPLPDVALRGDAVNLALADPKKVVNLAEARARTVQRRNGSRTLRGTDRQFAEALHREADLLHHKGDYETALVLYHRAAKICPRDSSHGVAARRTSAAINILANPSRVLSKLLPKAKNSDQLAAILCPESAALRASRIMKESLNPASAVTHIVKYFDSRPDFWKIPRLPKEQSIVNATLSKVASKEAPVPVNVSLKRMSTALSAGEASMTLRIGNELLMTVAESHDDCRQRTAVFRLMSLAHISMGRHDRAVGTVTRMVSSARKSGDAILMAQSLVTLGKVHLTFGHLDASARAWERLAKDVAEPIPRAWLLHEIGRCYLESGKYSQARVMADICLESAVTARSTKWMLYGKLLSGQALVKLGRFSDALEALRVAANIAEDEGDTPTLAYVRDLAAQVACILEGVSFHVKISEAERQEVSKTSVLDELRMETSSGEAKQRIWNRKFVSDLIASPKLVTSDSEALLSSRRFYKDTSSSDEEKSSTEFVSEINGTPDSVSSPEEATARPDIRVSEEKWLKELPLPLQQTETTYLQDEAGSKLSLTQESASRNKCEGSMRRERENWPAVANGNALSYADGVQSQLDIAGLHKMEGTMNSADASSCEETENDRSIERHIVTPEVHYVSVMEDRLDTAGTRTVENGTSYTHGEKEHQDNTGNESNLTGRTYGVSSSDALCRHSLPSTPRRQDAMEEASSCEGFTTCFHPRFN